MLPRVGLYPWMDARFARAAVMAGRPAHASQATDLGAARAAETPELVRCLAPRGSTSAVQRPTDGLRPGCAQRQGGKPCGQLHRAYLTLGNMAKSCNAHRSHTQHGHPHRHTPPQHATTQGRRGCLATGQRCRPRKHGKGRPCTQCCDGVSHRDPDGKAACGCQPNGGACSAETAHPPAARGSAGTAPVRPLLLLIPPCPACQSCGTDGRCVPVADGTPCDDGNACTIGESCRRGVCVGGALVVCSPPRDPCHLAGSCDPATGTCTNPAKPNGTACTDGNLSPPDRPVRMGSAQAVNSGSVRRWIHVTMLAPVIPPPVSARPRPRPMAPPCDDGNACTTGETCQDGVCQRGMPVTCTTPQTCCQRIL